MKANKYPFAQELITDTEGNIRKVIIDFDDYQRLLEAIEDEGLILAMKHRLTSMKHEQNLKKSEYPVSTQFSERSQSSQKYTLL